MPSTDKQGFMNVFGICAFLLRFISWCQPFFSFFFCGCKCFVWQCLPKRSTSEHDQGHYWNKPWSFQGTVASHISFNMLIFLLFSSIYILKLFQHCLKWFPDLELTKCFLFFDMRTNPLINSITLNRFVLETGIHSNFEMVGG